MLVLRFLMPGFWGAKTQIITEPQIGIEPVPFLLLDKVRHGADWRMGADMKCLMDRHSMREKSMKGFTKK